MPGQAQRPDGEQRNASQRRTRRASLSRTRIERAWRAGAGVAMRGARRRLVFNYEYITINYTEIIPRLSN